MTKYNIISINDWRSDYKRTIRKRVGLEEVSVPSVDAYAVDLSVELEKRRLRINTPGMFSAGEVGIWLSTFDCWQWAYDNDDDLLVFEDDAIPHPLFAEKWPELASELPPNYDFMAVWVPPNQYLDYVYDVVYDEEGNPTHVGPHRNSITSMYNFGAMRLAKVYQGYGNVAMLYSPQGAGRMIELARQRGMHSPIDCWIFAEAHAGRLDGYAPKPNRAKIVTYDWKAQTTVHREDRV